jgi:hypothetical protein
MFWSQPLYCSHLTIPKKHLFQCHAILFWIQSKRGKYSLFHKYKNFYFYTLYTVINV